ncbi:MAG: ADP-glyceromanno-heptose 6-epimerase [Desulfovibrio sp.]|nr:ADP-glyceromanno-heptose 6-epimerase [Desulfovibrio sp.]
MYIVTGGAGFIGSAMVWRLNKAGITDILVVDNLASTEKWKNLVNRRYAGYMHRSAFLEAMGHNSFPGRVEAVIHLGACSSTTERDADFLMSNNTSYSQEVCRFALEKGARFINASSAATYGDGSQGFVDAQERLHQLKPLNMYGYSKQLFDLWLVDNGMADKVVSLKFFNVYGPNEYHKDDMRSVVCKAFHEISASGRLRLFKSCHPDYPDGGQKRYFVYVKDCVELIFRLLQHPDINGIRNVGTGQARTWNDLAHAVFKAMHREPAIDYVDMPLHLQGKYQNFTQADMSWLEKEGLDLAFPFMSLEDGVDDYVRHYLALPDPYLEMV